MTARRESKLAKLADLGRHTCTQQLKQLQQQQWGQSLQWQSASACVPPLHPALASPIRAPTPTPPHAKWLFLSQPLQPKPGAMLSLCCACRVGFNSVYHVTDLPGFVSGEHLVFFDPHCKYLPSISAANPGKKINFVAHPVNSKLADQVVPFHFFGCDTQQLYQGTLFRFPLRTQEQADASTISKQVGSDHQ